MSMMTLLKQNWDTIGLYGETIFISICVLFVVAAAVVKLPWKSQELQQTCLELDLVLSVIVRKIRSGSFRVQKALGNLKRCLRPRRT